MLGAITVQYRIKDDTEDAAADGGDTEDLIMIVSGIKKATSTCLSLPPTKTQRCRDAWRSSPRTEFPERRTYFNLLDS